MRDDVSDEESDANESDNDAHDEATKQKRQLCKCFERTEEKREFDGKQI